MTWRTKSDADVGAKTAPIRHGFVRLQGKFFSIALRSGLLALAMATLFQMTSGSLFAQHRQSSSKPAPHPTQPAAHTPSHSSPGSTGHAGGQAHPSGDAHLSEWLQKNKNLSSQEQVQKLQQEKGFNRLTPQQQQNVTNRLQQLNQMNPAQRQRVLDRVENMERLSPQQQQQVRGSARQLGQMPPDRQQAVKDAIRNLRNVPPAQRQAELNSSKYAGLSPEERGVAGSLLSVESYHPPAPSPPQQ